MFKEAMNSAAPRTALFLMYALIVGCAERPSTDLYDVTVTGTVAPSQTYTLAPAKIDQWEIVPLNTPCIPPQAVEEGALDAIGGVAYLGNGIVAVANTRTHEVLLFDTAGAFLNRLGGLGSGPGEFRNLVWVGTGTADTGLAYDHALRRITAFSAEGTILGSSPVPPPPVRDSAAIAGFAGVTAAGEIILYAMRREAVPAEGRSRPDMIVYRWKIGQAQLQRVIVAAGREIQLESLGDPDAGMAILTPLFRRETFVRPAGARIVFAPADELTFTSLDLNDREALTIQVEWPSIPASNGWIDAAIDSITEDVPRVSPEILTALRTSTPETLPLLLAMEVDSEHNIWVLPRSARVGELSPWYVFSPAGQPLAEVPVPPVDRLVHIGTDFVVALERNEDGVRVPCFFRLEKRHSEAADR